MATKLEEIPQCQTQYQPNKSNRHLVQSAREEKDEEIGVVAGVALDVFLESEASLGGRGREGVGVGEGEEGAGPGGSVAGEVIGGELGEGVESEEGEEGEEAGQEAGAGGRGGGGDGGGRGGAVVEDFQVAGVAEP